MAKDERNIYTIQNDASKGEIKIADEVVAIIAALAATEVEGVASMAGNITNELIGKLGMKNLSKGVKVDVLEGIVTVSLALNLKYNYSIVEVSARVQEKVKNAIENMTGLEVADVNIKVAGVEMESQEKKRTGKESANMVRKELREHIFKMLFQIEFNDPQEMPEQIEYYFSTLEDAADKDKEYIKRKYAAVLEKTEEIDELINANAKGWKTTRMNKVDLSILRLAVYEMKWDDEVPVGVAINEAVELTKMFSSDEAPSFINGVLGKIARSLEETKE